MIFSELSLAECDTGLRYDADQLTLSGERRGYGIAVSEADGEYRLAIYSEAPDRREKEIFSRISALSAALPKNALLSQRREADAFVLVLRRDPFLQEKLPALFDFADQILGVLAEAKIGGKPVPPLGEAAKPVKKENEEKGGKIKLGFDLGSVKGLGGAVVGAAAMVFIAMASVDLRSTSGIGGTITELGGYVLSAAATLLIFSDYRFLARKLDAFGVVICPILSVLCAVFSALLATARAFAAAEEIPISAALPRLAALYGTEPEIAAFGAGYLLTGTVTAGFASLLYCLWYFKKHPDEMIRSEKPSRAKGEK